MTDIAARVEAALTAMEAAAEAATPGPWEHLPGKVGKPTVSRADALGRVAFADHKADAAHIARHDPAAVLRMVAGLRAVVALHEPFECCNMRCPTGLHCGTCAPRDDDAGVDFLHSPCPTLLAVAAAVGVEVGE